MLETVKKAISELPKESFNQYYMNYILEIQDKSIDEEFKYLRRHNKLDILNIDRWISSYLDRLVKRC